MYIAPCPLPITNQSYLLAGEVNIVCAVPRRTKKEESDRRPLTTWPFREFDKIAGLDPAEGTIDGRVCLARLVGQDGSETS